MRLLLAWKLIKKRFFAIPSFCKCCGRDVHDFIAPNDTWKQIEPHIKYGHVLCYDCFCEICSRAGIYPIWQLMVVMPDETNHTG